MPRLHNILVGFGNYYTGPIEVVVGDTMNYAREKFRPGEILEGTVLTKEEYKKTQTVTFFINPSGNMTGGREDNFYDAGSCSS